MKIERFVLKPLRKIERFVLKQHTFRFADYTCMGIPSMHSRNFPFSCGFLSKVAVECSVLNFSLCSFE
nr:MAG TPA: hypothetical protein [Caudoviricetes sp.]